MIISRINSKGFTLIELLVVVSIISVLASVVLASLNSARINARDAERNLDLHNIKNAIALYYDDHQCYPGCAGPTTPLRSSIKTEWDQLRGWLAPYMKTVPVDPVNVAPLIYTYESSDWANADYTLTAKFEKVLSPTYRGGAGGNFSGVNPIILTPSTGAQSGDLILLVASTDSTSNTFTWPAGFAENAASIICNADGQTMRFATKIASGSEPASYSITHSSGSYSGAAIAIYSGVNTTNPIDVTPTTNVVSTLTASPWSITATGVAAGTAKRLLVGIAGVDNNMQSMIITTVPSPSPSAWSLRVDTGTAIGGSNIGIFDAVDTAGTFTSNVISTQTQSGSTNGGKMAFLIALRPQ